jgi:hypothetical protein
MNRIVAALAVAVSVDILMFDGRFSGAAEHLLLAILRGFGAM